MKSLSTFLLLFLFIGFSGYSQSLELSQQNGYLVISNSGELDLTYLPSEEFQSLDWQSGYAYYLDGSSRQFEGMKYDPEMDIIQVNAGGNILTLLPGVINGVSIESGENVIRVFIKVPLEKAVFMEALSIGKIHLLMYRKLIEEETDDFDYTTIRMEKKQKIIEYDEFIYVWSEGGVEKFKGSKKAVLKLMADQKESIEEFIDDNKTKMKEASSLMLLFDYYNSL